MKRVKSLKQFGVRQSLFIAGMVIASASAQAAALPKITITGVVDTGIQYLDGYTGPIAYDFSAWFGKSYTLELTPDAAGVVKRTEASDISGVSENIWAPANVAYRLTIDGAVVFSGVDNQFSDVVTINDATVPAGFPNLPPGVIADGAHTYDDYTVSASGINLGCFDGGSNNFCDGGSADIFEYGVIEFDHIWDTAQYNAILDSNYPDLLNAAPDFGQGFGLASVIAGHYSPLGGTGINRASVAFSVDSVTVTAVPEAETYAMMLAGLGLVGWTTLRRRRTSFKQFGHQNYSRVARMQ